MPFRPISYHFNISSAFRTPSLCHGNAFLFTSFNLSSQAESKPTTHQKPIAHH